ncbi:MAG: hypothetical protein MUE85_11735 [Microscillaceae bacterium]|jgi:hypothetical protein|nr:hypothetical protein [Microscillaceae bacterium]
MSFFVGLSWEGGFAQPPSQNVNLTVKNTNLSTKNLPKGYFLQDSVKIGLSFYYILTYRHSADLQVIFPDSSYKFLPFELVNKAYFPTITQNQISTDSVVYELKTFEINPIQKLALPVFVSAERDCTQVMYALPDSVFLQESVKGNPIGLPLKALTQYQPVQEYFNYPYLITGIFVFLVIVIIIWGLLGKQIIKAYQMFQFRTRHAVFLKEFGRLANRITSQQASEDIEKATILWKRHLEYIENQPFSTYTSKEISKIVPDTQLGDSLKNIDKAIYGKEISDEIGDSLAILRNFAVNRYDKQREKLRNA